MIIRETVNMLNFLLEKRVIKKNIEIDDFKERIDIISILFNKILRDGNEEFLIHFNNIEKVFNELSTEELKEFKDDKNHMSNKKISRKYRGLLKDNLALVFDNLRNVSLEDLAMIYNIKIYPIILRKW